MLQEHREQLDTRRNRQDDSPLIVGAYSVDEIKDFNLKHDERMGWNPGQGNFYSNVTRLQETHVGTLEQLWEQR